MKIKKYLTPPGSLILDTVWDFFCEQSKFQEFFIENHAIKQENNVI